MNWQRAHQFQCFWMLPLIAITALAIGYGYEREAAIGELLWLIPAGVLAWTLIEYMLHRFVFHLGISNPRIRALVDSFHHEHHVHPRDVAYLFVRPGYAIAVSLLLAGVLVALTDNLFRTAGLISGIWTGFLWYESVHYRVHLTAANGGWIGHRRRAHFQHHFHSSKRRFGVTTSLWDHVFRTG